MGCRHRSKIHHQADTAETTGKEGPTMSKDRLRMESQREPPFQDERGKRDKGEAKERLSQRMELKKKKYGATKRSSLITMEKYPLDLAISWRTVLEGW